METSLGNGSGASSPEGFTPVFFSGEVELFSLDGLVLR